MKPYTFKFFTNKNYRQTNKFVSCQNKQKLNINYSYNNLTSITNSITNSININLKKHAK